jgi:hypothetical protein
VHAQSRNKFALRRPYVTLLEGGPKMMNLVAYFSETDLPRRESEEWMSSGVTKKYADRKLPVRFVSKTLGSGCVLYTLLPDITPARQSHPKFDQELETPHERQPIPDNECESENRPRPKNTDRGRPKPRAKCDPAVALNTISCLPSWSGDLLRVSVQPSPLAEATRLG